MPKSRERLANHYLRTAGIAAICIHTDGAFMAYRTIGLELPAGLVCFGCMRGDAKRLAAHARRCRGDQTAVAAQGRAASLRISISASHHTA